MKTPCQKLGLLGTDPNSPGIFLDQKWKRCEMVSGWVGVANNATLNRNSKRALQVSTSGSWITLVIGEESEGQLDSFDRYFSRGPNEQRPRRSGKIPTILSSVRRSDYHVTIEEGGKLILAHGEIILTGVGVHTFRYVACKPTFHKNSTIHFETIRHFWWGGMGGGGDGGGMYIGKWSYFLHVKNNKKKKKKFCLM